MLQIHTHRNAPARLLPALALLALAALPASAAQAEGKLVIKAGRVIPHGGADPIENGVIVIEKGRITAVGDKDTQVPWDAVVLDYPEYTAFPGFVESHTVRGTDRPNENIDVVPFLSVRDSVDPVSFYFEDALRWGITTINVQQGPEAVIAGQGMIVRPIGMTVEEMTLRPSAGVKLVARPKSRGFSSATQLQVMRRAFGDLRRYLEQLVADKKDGNDRARREALFQGRDLTGDNAKGRAMEGSAWKVAGLEGVPRGEIDAKQAPLLALVEGKMSAYIACASPMDVHHALQIARENGFLARSVLVISADCWKAADEIAEAGVPVILEGELMHSERDLYTGKLVETFVPRELNKRGIRFSLSSPSGQSSSLAYQAALAVGEGLARPVALDAVTRTAAQILGLGDRVGSLEVGRDGNVLLLSGDPLSVTTWVERVVIEGREVYDRSKDIRNRHLLEGRSPTGTTPMGAGPEDAHVHDELTPPEDHPDTRKDKKPGEAPEKGEKKDPPKGEGHGGGAEERQ